LAEAGGGLLGDHTAALGTAALGAAALAKVLQRRMQADDERE
jgi:hypothetical protein